MLMITLYAKPFYFYTSSNLVFMMTRRVSSSHDDISETSWNVERLASKHL